MHQVWKAVILLQDHPVGRSQHAGKQAGRAVSFQKKKKSPCNCQLGFDIHCSHGSRIVFSWGMRSAFCGPESCCWWHNRSSQIAERPSADHQQFGKPRGTIGIDLGWYQSDPGQWCWLTSCLCKRQGLVAQEIFWTWEVNCMCLR